MNAGKNRPDSDPRIVYADIIDLPHHQSDKHPHMSLYDRSAQFASYKALSGYEDMVAEELRQTDRETKLSDVQLEILNQKLSLIEEVTKKGEHPFLTFTVFEPNSKKAGGKYLEITDAVKKIDTANRQIILMSVTELSGVNKTISFNSLIDIQGEPVNYLDDRM